MRGIDTNNVLNRLIESFIQRYQDGLETRMRGTSYVHNQVKLLEYHFHKISLRRGSWYIPTLEWIANEKCSINPKNTKDNRCYLYAIVTALNYNNVPNRPGRTSNLVPFIPNYNWGVINFPPGPKEYSDFEKNNGSKRNLTLKLLILNMSSICLINLKRLLMLQKMLLIF